MTAREESSEVADPEGRFHLILCRNLVFTYFALPLQRRILTGIREELLPGGVLVLGRHERLPQDNADLRMHPRVPEIFARSLDLGA